MPCSHISGRRHNDLPICPMNDSWSWSHMSTRTTDGNYLKDFCQSVQKKATWRKRRKKLEWQLQSLLRCSQTQQEWQFQTFLRYMQTQWNNFISLGTIQREYKGHKNSLTIILHQLNFYFLIQNDNKTREISWYELCFTISVKKYDDLC